MRRGPELEVGATYETLSGLTFVVLSPPEQPWLPGSRTKAWKTLVLVGIWRGPTEGDEWEILQDSRYHQNCKRL